MDIRQNIDIRHIQDTRHLPDTRHVQDNRRIEDSRHGLPDARHGSDIRHGLETRQGTDFRPGTDIRYGMDLRLGVENTKYNPRPGSPNLKSRSNSNSSENVSQRKGSSSSSRKNLHRDPDISDRRTPSRLFSGKDIDPEYSSERRRDSKDGLDKGSVVYKDISHLVKPVSHGTFVRAPAPTGDLQANYDPRNFSFRLKDRESVVVEESSRRCSWRDACCSSLYLGVAAIILTLVVFLLSTSPHHYRYCWREGLIEQHFRLFVLLSKWFHSKCNSAIVLSMCHNRRYRPP